MEAKSTELKYELKRQIGKGKVQEVFDFLHPKLYTAEGFAKEHNELVILEFQFNRSQENNRKNTLSYEKIGLSDNKVVSGLLELIDRIDLISLTGIHADGEEVDPKYSIDVKINDDLFSKEDLTKFIILMSQIVEDPDTKAKSIKPGSTVFTFELTQKQIILIIRAIKERQVNAKFKLNSDSTPTWLNKMILEGFIQREGFYLPLEPKVFGGMVLKTQELKNILDEPNSTGLAFGLPMRGKSPYIDLIVYNVKPKNNSLVGEERSIRFKRGAASSNSTTISPTKLKFEYIDKLERSGFDFAYLDRKSFEEITKGDPEELFIAGASWDFGSGNEEIKGEWFTLSVTARKEDFIDDTSINIGLPSTVQILPPCPPIWRPGTVKKTMTAGAETKRIELKKE